MTVPEATIDLDNFFPSGENDIGFASKIGVMNPETVSQPVQIRSHE